MLKSIIYSEWIKYFSYPWCLLGFFGAAILPPLALFFYHGAGIKLHSSEVLTLYSQFLYLGQAGVILAAAGLWGQEFSHAALRTTLLTAPSRKKLLMAKETMIVVTSFLAALLSCMLCFVVIFIKFNDLFHFDLMVKLITAVISACISWTLLGGLASSLSIIARSMTLPIAILFPSLFGFSQMLFMFTIYAKFLPDLAGMSLFLTSKQHNYLSPWSGIAVQMIWVFIFGFLSTYLLQKRDVR